MSQYSRIGLKTIRQAASIGICPESRLRKLVKENKVPGIYVGNRFYVNCDLFYEQLNEMSWKQVNKSPECANKP